jgi:hypothetical protein
MRCARERRWPSTRRESEAFVLEELVDVTWCYAVAICDFDDRQIVVTQISVDVGHDQSQPSRGDAASLGNRLAIARGADGCGDKIMHVADHEPLQLRHAERQRVGNRAGISDEQVQRLGAMWDETYRKVIDAANQRSVTRIVHL